MNNNLQDQNNLYKMINENKEQDNFVNNTNKDRSTNLILNIVFYSIGIATIIIGYNIYLTTIWDSLGSLMKVFLTLGVGLILAIFGTILLLNNSKKIIGSILHFIAGIYILSGSTTIVSESGIDLLSENFLIYAFSFSIVSAFYILLRFRIKSDILTFYAIISITRSLYSYMFFIANKSTYVFDITLLFSIIIGVSYLLLSLKIKNFWNNTIEKLLNFVGSVFITTSSIMFAINYVLWQILHVFVLAAILYSAVKLKSKIILTIGTLSLVLYIIFISGNYFSESFGWPLLLVLLGFIFIAIGYFTVNLMKKIAK